MSMYKLRIKKAEQQTITTKYYNTIQEVTDYFKLLLNSESLAEMLQKKKELNFRFYLSYKKEN